MYAAFCAGASGSQRTQRPRAFGERFRKARRHLIVKKTERAVAAFVGQLVERAVDQRRQTVVAARASATWSTSGAMVRWSADRGILTNIDQVRTGGHLCETAQVMEPGGRLSPFVRSELDQLQDIPGVILRKNNASIRRRRDLGVELCPVHFRRGDFLPLAAVLRGGRALSGCVRATDLRKPG